MGFYNILVASSNSSKILLIHHGASTKSVLTESRSAFCSRKQSSMLASGVFF